MRRPRLTSSTVQGTLIISVLLDAVMAGDVQTAQHFEGNAGRTATAAAATAAVAAAAAAAAAAVAVADADAATYR